MRTSVVHSLAAVSAAAWNGLARRHPFVRHEFLHALERSGCVGGDTGWEPHYVLLHDAGGTLVGATPLYLKYHSYGEYVFDWAWAEAHQRHGYPYYPKLIAAVPFTPATGPRLLVDNTAADADAIRARLFAAAREAADRLGCSSLHWLFTDAEDGAWLAQQPVMQRTGYQFHWSNRGYENFDDYLAVFTADRRKKIKQERRYVRQAGVQVEVIPGNEASSTHWDTLYHYYCQTIRRHGAMPYLNRDFFHLLGDTLPTQTVLVFAHRERQPVAAALNVRGDDTLYGRYWGGEPGINALHFETCYYTPIEYCIAHRLARFEAGAQGEHKLARGLAPTRTFSFHWLRHAPFQHAVADFLTRERRGVEHYLDELNDHMPFKQTRVNNE